MSRIIPLAGELDAWSARDACAPLRDLSEPAVIDLAAVTLLGAAGLNELARVARRVGARRLTLARPTPPVRRVLELMKFDELFVIAGARSR